MARIPHFRRGAIGAAVAAAFLLPSISAARDEVLFMQGDAAPGVPGATFASFGDPAINIFGALGFTAVLSGGGITTANDEAIYNRTVLTAREGSPAPGIAGVTFDTGFTFAGETDLNSVVFRANLAGSGVDATNNSAIYSGSSLIARTGTQAPLLATGVVMSSLGVPQISNNSQIVYTVGLSGTGVVTTNDQAIYRAGLFIAREGDPAPGLPAGINLSLLTNTPQVNNAGQVLWSSFLSGPGVNSFNNQVLYRDTTLVMHQGDQAPGLAAGVNWALSTAKFNNAGQAAFNVFLTGPGVDSSNDRAIYRDSTLIARKGDAAPGTGPGVFIGTPSITAFSDAGHAVFVTFLTGAVDSTNDTAIYRNSTLIAREGNTMPGLAAGNGFAILNTSPAVNNAGHVLFTGVDTSGRSAMWLGDGVEALSVTRFGQVIGTKTVSFWGNISDARINDAAQVTYNALFTDGTHALVTFTPELHWRQSASGNWDSANNWTLGISPTSLYDMKIDPSASVTITGPALDRVVRSLEIGGGTGIATLSLLGGKLTQANGGSVLVLANGVLTGDGAIGGDVLNFGTVRAQNVTIDGVLTSQGLVTGNGRINAPIDNINGRISVASGQSLLLNGVVINDFAGSVDVIGGELETRGAFANDGQVIARNAVLRFSGGLTNTGQVALSFGASDVFGNISNGASGRLIVSNGAQASFYGPVVNNGELRVSAGGAANFFGLVKGAGSFTGAGEVRFEGGFSPGNSPALVTLNTVTTFSATSPITMELAGLTPGSGYDKIIFNNAVTLEGGDLDVVWLNGWSGSAGDRYDLFDWNGALSGTFGHVLLPSLASGLSWDVAGLYTTGEIGILGPVPEPETYAMLMAGLGLLGFALRRRRSALARFAS